jgi:transposase-like protein
MPASLHRQPATLRRRVDRRGAGRAAREQVVKQIRRATRRQFSAEKKIRIVLSGLRRGNSITELCRREGIIQNLYYRWLKEFLQAFQAGKKRWISTARLPRRWPGRTASSAEWVASSCVVIHWRHLQNSYRRMSPS